MSNIKLPLATSTWDSCEIEAINEIIKSEKYTMGDKVSQFEKEFASFVDSKYAIMVNSGSSANLLAIASLFYCKENPLKKNDEVIVPAVSWSTTFSPLAQYDLKLKFVDIDPHTFNLDLKKLNDAITEKTKAIFAVNLLGNSINYFEMVKNLNKNIWLIEDNCESMGATLNNKQAGTFGIMGTFSTFFSHHISTIEGGIIVTDNEEIYHILLSIRSHGWTRHLPDDNKIYKKTNNDNFDFNFILPGYNLRPTEINAAIGIEQLKKLPNLILGRRKNAKFFQEKFKEIKGIYYQKETGKSSWFAFAIILEKGGRIKRDEIVKILKENGFQCRSIVAGNFLRNSVIKYYNYTVHDNLNNSDKLHDCGFYIGNHHFDISEQLIQIADLIKKNL